MGLRIKRGPAWHNDAFGYINSNVSEMNIRERHYEMDTVSDDEPEKWARIIHPNRHMPSTWDGPGDQSKT